MLRYNKYSLKSFGIQLALTLLINGTTTLLLVLFQGNKLTDVNIVVIYILSVLIISSITKGYSYGIMASIISMLSFNFYFIEPVFTLKVNDKAYILTFIIMLLSAIFTSTLASKMIRSKELADERENQSHILYSITSSLAKTSELPEVASVSSECLSSLFECDVICLITSAKGKILHKFLAEKGKSEIINQKEDSVILKDILNNYSSHTILARDNISSYICMPVETKSMSHERKYLLDSTLIQITNAMERVLLIQDKEAAKSETERERYKTNLLRAISHDIRTPLTRITGAAQMLHHTLKDCEDLKLLNGIYEDSIWLTRLVENILSLTRIQEGKLTIHIQPEVVEEIIAGAINQASKYSPNHKISITIPEAILFVPMDGKLIEQVLINLVINAIEHSNPLDEITVSVKPEDNKIWFEVKDSGAGINEEEINKIFEMFSVSNSTRTDGKQGVGLGLTICKAIVNFHGGEIFATNNAEGGSTFRFYLNIK